MLTVGTHEETVQMLMVTGSAVQHTILIVLQTRVAFGTVPMIECLTTATAYSHILPIMM